MKPTGSQKIIFTRAANNISAYAEELATAVASNNWEAAAEFAQALDHEVQQLTTVISSMDDIE